MTQERQLDFLLTGIDVKEVYDDVSVLLLLTLNMFFSEAVIYLLWKISRCYQETMCDSALLSRFTALLIGPRHGCFSWTSAGFSEKPFFETVTSKCFPFLLANISMAPRIKIFM